MCVSLQKNFSKSFPVFKKTVSVKWRHQRIINPTNNFAVQEWIKQLLRCLTASLSFQTNHWLFAFQWLFASRFWSDKKLSILQQRSRKSIIAITASEHIGWYFFIRIFALVAENYHFEISSHISNMAADADDAVKSLNVSDTCWDW